MYCLFSRRSSLSLSPSNRPRNQAYPSSCMIRAKPNPLRGPTNSPEHRDWTLEHLFRLQDPSPHHPHQQHPCPPRECATAPRILALPRRAGEHSAKQAPESFPVVCRITAPGPGSKISSPRDALLLKVHASRGRSSAIPRAIRRLAPHGRNGPRRINAPKGSADRGGPGRFAIQRRCDPAAAGRYSATDTPGRP